MFFYDAVSVKSFSNAVEKLIKQPFQDKLNL